MREQLDHVETGLADSGGVMRRYRSRETRHELRPCYRGDDKLWFEMAIEHSQAINAHNRGQKRHPKILDNLHSQNNEFSTRSPLQGSFEAIRAARHHALVAC